MLWPLILPLQITCCILAAVIAAGTVVAPSMKRSRRKTLVVLTIVSCVLFIPSCAGVTAIVDAYRFGKFQYSSFGDLQDFRVERYIPKEARNITVNKYAMGHKAKYSISELELKSHLDQLWGAHGKYSAIPREKLNNGAVASADKLKAEFAGLNWPLLENAVELHSPVEGDGGGATFYFNRESSVVYHRAEYW